MLGAGASLPLPAKAPALYVVVGRGATHYHDSSDAIFRERGLQRGFDSDRHVSFIDLGNSTYAVLGWQLHRAFALEGGYTKGPSLPAQTNNNWSLGPTRDRATLSTWTVGGAASQRLSTHWTVRVRGGGHGWTGKFPAPRGGRASRAGGIDPYGGFDFRCKIKGGFDVGLGADHYFGRMMFTSFNVSAGYRL